MTIRNNFEKMSRRDIARLGGLARQARHGDLGTAAGRRKGGLNSQKTHRIMPSGFKTLRTITIPAPSNEMAEFIGMIMGDGHVGLYQMSLTTNSVTDLQHAKHFISLVWMLFNIRARIAFKKGSKACVVTLNSKFLCDYLHTQGLPRGSKVRLGVTIPAWIRQNQQFSFACARGLFDTDGCVYKDNHYICGKKYSHLGLAFANNEKNILNFFKITLEQAGLKPTQKTKFRVFLRRAGDIDKYFSLIGTANPKHKRRYKLFRRKPRRGVRVVE